MVEDPIAIARVTLARAVPRVLAVPAGMLVLAAAAVAGGFVVPAGIDAVLWVLAGVLVGAAVLIALIPLTLRLEVEVGGLRLRWLAGSRRFHLVPGAVTRVSMAGNGRSVVRARLGFLGWAYGAAMLRGEEEIWIVRLAPSPTVILVPTDRGRLAIAASSEPELIEALGAAARVQQRLDEVSGRVHAALPAPAEPAGQPEPSGWFSQASAAPEAPQEAAGGPRVLTGIERARLEAELAAARQAALEAAEAERRAMEDARLAGAAGTAEAAPSAPRMVPQEEPPVPWRTPGPARQRIRGTWTRPAWATDARVRVLATIGWAVIPIGASLVAYLVAGGGATLSAGDVATRMEALALVACGPLAAIGVLAARAWWPRLSGLVTVSSLSALVLLARAVSG
jgi:hypothetical protein